MVLLTVAIGIAGCVRAISDLTRGAGDEIREGIATYSKALLLLLGYFFVVYLVPALLFMLSLYGLVRFVKWSWNQ